MAAKSRRRTSVARGKIAQGQAWNDAGTAPLGSGQEDLMPSEFEIEAKFWKALKEDKTLLLGLLGRDDALAQPMTAQFIDDQSNAGGIWFFTGRDTDLARAVGGGHPAQASFASKGHDLFASLEGDPTASEDRAVIDRLWNPFVAAWFKGGKSDPDLRLLRFRPERAQIWLNDSSLFAGVKLLLGSDPKRDYAGKTADVRF
jgi:general stress protein 26